MLKTKSQDWDYALSLLSRSMVSTLKGFLEYCDGQTPFLSLLGIICGKRFRFPLILYQLLSLPLLLAKLKGLIGCLTGVGHTSQNPTPNTFSMKLS